MSRQAVAIDDGGVDMGSKQEKWQLLDDRGIQKLYARTLPTGTLYYASVRLGTIQSKP